MTRQAFSFGSHSAPESILAALSAFAALYGLWFGTMELLLRHPGYLGREWIAGILLGQASLTLLFLLAPGLTRLRPLVAIGCLPLLCLVGLVVRGLVTGAEIEGYVLIMALSLAFQAALTVYVLLRRDDRHWPMPIR